MTDAVAARLDARRPFTVEDCDEALARIARLMKLARGRFDYESVAKLHTQADTMLDARDDLVKAETERGL